MTALEKLQAETQPAVQSNDPRQLTRPLTLKDLVLLTDAIANSSGGSSYLVYTALLTQTGTDAPVATVLQNTLGGTVVWTYEDFATYQGTLTGAFTDGKTFVSFYTARSAQGFIAYTDVDSINLIGDDNYGSTTVPISLEIRVYP